MQTWPSSEAYEGMLAEERGRVAAEARDRRDPAMRCEHGVSTLRTCKACGIPPYWEEMFQRLWAAQPGPGIAATCACGQVTHSDTEWDEHLLAAGDGVVHSARP